MRVLIYGAGATGCYVAAQCLIAGIDTELVCRPRIQEQLKHIGGIKITDYADRLNCSSLPVMHTKYVGGQYDICLVTLKCHHLESAAVELAAISGSGCELHFLQNGLEAFKSIQQLAALGNAYSGIVPFNVVNQAKGHFHQATEGLLQLQRTKHTATLANLLEASAQSFELFDDISPVVHGKLLLNLNNALNALVDQPLKSQLEQRPYRQVLANAQREYLAYCKKVDQELHLSVPLPAKLLPRLLSLPNFLFTRIAKSMLAIDPLARSSMWEDIKQGRKTEIEFLNGRVVELCHAHNIPCPVNERIVSLIHKLESGESIDSQALLT